MWHTILIFIVLWIILSGVAVVAYKDAPYVEDNEFDELAETINKIDKEN